MNQLQMQRWSQQKLIQWMNSLDAISQGNKNRIIQGLKAFGATGADVFDIDHEELADGLEISTMLAKQLYRAIRDQRGAEFQLRQPGASSFVIEGNDTFSVNIQGQAGKYTTIDKLKASYTVRELKQRYLESCGKDKGQYKELTMRRTNTKLKDECTLRQYNIFNDTIVLYVAFRVKGGSTLRWIFGYEDEKLDDVDIKIEKEERVRKLRYKKYKEIILSNEADCIMGYTNKDGIKRAKMPCGCSFASDTMYRFMKAAFEKEGNYRQVKMKCPMPKNQCKGSEKDRKWDWSLVFIVADLSANEILKYNKIIANQMDGIKKCPHCQFNCERPNDLTKFRVRCTNCNGSNWCWGCRGVWKSNGSIVCGNGNCVAERLNEILQSANIINTKVNENCDWASNISVPDIRHCPKCYTIIEYIQDCRHMTCSCCPHQFCFKCLGDWKSKDGKTNIHDASQCNKVAPIQQISG